MPGQLSQTRFYTTANKLPDGRVIVPGGGFDNFGIFYSLVNVDVFIPGSAPGTGAWGTIKSLAHRRRSPLRQKNAPAVLVCFKRRPPPAPAARDQFRHRKSVPRVINRRLEQIPPRYAAKFPVQLVPSIDASRHRHR